MGGVSNFRNNNHTPFTKGNKYAGNRKGKKTVKKKRDRIRDITSKVKFRNLISEFVNDMDTFEGFKQAYEKLEPKSKTI